MENIRNDRQKGAGHFFYGIIKLLIQKANAFLKTGGCDYAFCGGYAIEGIVNLNGHKWLSELEEAVYDGDL